MTGEVLDGLPNGQGKFESETSDGLKWYYEGEFKEGLFDGYGKTVWESGVVNEGEYDEGEFTPTIAELTKALGTIWNTEFSVSKDNMEYLTEHKRYFPAKSEAYLVDAQWDIDNELTYKQMIKTLRGYEGKLFSCDEAIVVQVTERVYFGYTVTRLIAVDNDRNVYYIACYDSLDDVLGESEISFFGLPVDTVSYENVGGGTTNAVMIIACDVTLVD